MIRSILHIIVIIILLLQAMTGISYAAKSEKLKIVEVNFNGNKKYSDDRLYRVIVSKPSKWLRPSYYHEPVFIQDLDYLNAFYRNEGYLQAQIDDYSVAIDSSIMEVKIRIDLIEGKRTFLGQVDFEGNTSFSDSLLEDLIDWKPGEPFLRDKLEYASTIIRKQYMDNGFLDFELERDTWPADEAYQNNVTFVIKENTRFTIAKIRVLGIEKTRPRVVRRELPYDLRETVNYSNLLYSQRLLYLTGLYSTVSVQHYPADNGDSAQKDIWVELSERMSRDLNVGVGYGSVDQLRGKLELSSINLDGTSRKVGFIGKASFVGYHAEVFYTDPWVFNIPWRGDIRLLTDYAIEPTYEADKKAGELSFSKSFFINSSFTAGFRYEETEFSNVTIERDFIFDRRTNLRSLYENLVLDTRDNFFNPTRGGYYEWSNQFTGYFMDGSNNFVKTSLKLRYHRKITPFTILASGLEVSMMDSPEGLYGIPINERLYAGGPNSLRGFGYQLVGPLDDDRAPVGGRLKIVSNLFEVRQTLYKVFGAAAFLDVGNVWFTMTRPKLKDFRYSPGLGIRINTPIGMARVDYGINIDPKPEEPSGRFWFSLGHAF